MSEEQASNETPPAQTEEEGLKEIHLNCTGMSGRVVRFRVLDAEQVEEIEDNGARAAGEDADERKIRREQMKLLLAHMVHSYTEPNQAPEKAPILRDGKEIKDADGKPVLGPVPFRADQAKLKGVKFKRSSASALALHWGSLFGVKETQALRGVYMEHHDLNVIEMQMLLGKSRAVGTAD